jgi:hypothetical protein
MIVFIRAVFFDVAIAFGLPNCDTPNPTGYITRAVDDILAPNH